MPKWLKVALQLISYLATLVLGYNGDAIANTLM